MSETTLVKTVYLNASPEMVWEYLTDSDRLGLWYHHAAKDLSEGEDCVLL